MRVYPKFWVVSIVLVWATLVACGSQSDNATSAATVAPSESKGTATPYQLGVTPSSTKVNVVTTRLAVSIGITIVTDQDWEGSWLKGNPCAAPCWQGVIVGKTTAREAVQIWQKNAYFHNIVTDTNRNEIRWSFAYQRGGTATFGSAQTASLDEPVTSIEATLGYERFKSITGFYGEPSHVAAFAVRLMDNSISYHLNLIYLNQGFLIRTLDLTKPEISPELVLESPIFFTNGLAGLSRVANIEQKFLVQWQGFKDFDFYCRGGFADSDALDCSKVKTP